MKTIEKKILPMYFKDIVLGTKNFELCKDEDNIKVGDTLALKEWDNKYTGNKVNCEVKYILRDCPEYGLMPGYCIIGFDIIDSHIYPTSDFFEPSEKMVILKELAGMLDGMDMGDFQRDCHRDFAKKNNLVIVSGYSDDLMEFDGAIYDEAGCWDGGHVYFDKAGVDHNGRILPNVITGVWCGKVKDVPVENLDQFKTKDGDIFSWGYITDIPHVTFDIFDGGYPYCRGIIFSLEDVKD